MQLNVVNGFVNMMKRAVFFDRDGTIIFDPGYLSEAEQIQFFPGVLDKIRELKTRGFLIFIVTNQSGIGRGYFTEAQLAMVHEALIAMMKKEGASVDEIRYCPHAPEDECDDRKPSPKMVIELAEKHDIDLKKSFFVGDKMSDVLTGKNAGCRTVFILHNESKEEIRASVPDFTEPDYSAQTPVEALAWILNES